MLSQGLLWARAWGKIGVIFSMDLVIFNMVKDKL